MIGTTDDPTSDLEWHRKLKEEGFSVKVCPSFRPDPALNIHKNGFIEYIKKLSGVTGTEIKTIADVKKALTNRIAFFDTMGCKASDHGLDYVMYQEADEDTLNAILTKALTGNIVTKHEAEMYQTALLLHCAREYRRLGWVMQLHYNCMRNPNSTMFNKLGPDSGFAYEWVKQTGEKVWVVNAAHGGSAISSWLIPLVAENAGWKSTLLMWLAISAAGIAVCVGCIRLWRKIEKA